MKCPKCSFISFDHHEVCPKCGNDLSHERDLMNFPSYKPKPLSLLGVLTGDGEIPAVDALMGRSEASGVAGEGAEELLISLDSLSNEDHEPILIEPEPSLTASETETGGEAAGADEELTISLDDLSDEAPELVLFDPETEAAMLEVEIGDEAVFEPERFLSEGAGPEKEVLWKSEAIEQRMADMQLDDTSGKEIVASEREKETPGKGEKTEPDLFELELEPLEMDVEMKGSDKKTL